MLMTQLISDKQGFMSGHIPDLSMSLANTALLSEPIPFLHQQSGNSLAIIHDTVQGLDFIRVEGFVFSHVADEGIINACSGDLLQYRKHIGAESIQIFADIKKKHRSEIMADKIPLRDEASSPMSHSLDEVKCAVKIAVLVGSGVTLEDVRNYLDAGALIIGSYFKKEGYWANAVDPDRVKKFMEHISKLRE
ncbi:hypothetical protein DV515_00012671 [Chloebia gouldiae]|uniref:BtpA family membrane complex biogenesis protein n=1 Tax=Chloebia gouldiae TaxID=44316 RepID=A0A3L8S316_CHLGU|nr:hypothetical protein DV515_00012671 [Chloebia gouldiae]